MRILWLNGEKDLNIFNTNLNSDSLIVNCHFMFTFLNYFLDLDLHSYNKLYTTQSWCRNFWFENPI